MDGQPIRHPEYKKIRDDLNIINKKSGDKTVNNVITLSTGVDTAWIKHYGSNQVPSNDRTKAIATDDEGNIYVTGSTESTWTGSDFLTIKYDSLGNKIWEIIYNGPKNDDNQPNDIALDNNGNIYVTGSDFTTVKYSPNGEELWVVCYNSIEGINSCALEVDSIGNVYVAGECVTVKYNTDGIEQWAALYNGAGEFYWNAVTDIAVGSTGNVYVSGNFVDSNYVAYSSIIKYSSSGLEQWIERIDSSKIIRLALDGSENVYLTGGKGYYYNDPFGGEGGFVSDSLFTIKLNSDGINLWNASYCGITENSLMATDLALDDSGNLFVSGIGYESDDNISIVIKYSSGGIQQWKLNSDLTYISGIDLDSFSNILAAGQEVSSDTTISCTIIKYNPQGVVQWVSRYNSSNYLKHITAITISAGDNVCIAGWVERADTGDDWFTIRYNTEGIEQWISQYDGPGTSDDLARCIDIDDFGNVYVTGFSQFVLGWSTVKYNAYGQEQWIKNYSIPSSGYLTPPVDIDIDDLGDIYITGESGSDGQVAKYSTVKYSPDGVELWSKQDSITLIAPGIIGISDLAIDQSGNIIVTDIGGVFKYGTKKYNQLNGNTIWSTNYYVGGTSYAKAIAIDNLNNIYITGHTFPGHNNHFDFTTLKYNASGSQQWVATYNGPDSDKDEANALVVDDDGNVYVAGNSTRWENNESYTEWITIKYNNAGIQQWLRKRRMQRRSNEETNILLYEPGFVYVVGKDTSGFAVIKYTTDGTPIWDKNYLLQNMGFFDIVSTIDDEGNIYITNGIATLKINRDGQLQWEAIYNLNRHYDWGTIDIELDAAKNVYTIGTSKINNSTIYTTIKFIQTPTDLEHEALNSPTEFKLSQNYPNPFNPSTTIEFSIPKSEIVSLKIYNLLGQEVAALVSEKLAAGTHKYEWNTGALASGIYIYKVKAGRFNTAKKMILLR